MCGGCSRYIVIRTLWPWRRAEVSRIARRWCQTDSWRAFWPELFRRCSKRRRDSRTGWTRTCSIYVFPVRTTSAASLWRTERRIWCWPCLYTNKNGDKIIFEHLAANRQSLWSLIRMGGKVVTVFQSRGQWGWELRPPNATYSLHSKHKWFDPQNMYPIILFYRKYIMCFALAAYITTKQYGQGKLSEWNLLPTSRYEMSTT